VTSTRVAALGCFAFASLAIPWIGAGAWGGYLLVSVLRHRGEWAIFGFLLGVPGLVGGIVTGALAIARIRVGVGLWRADPSIVDAADRLADATIGLDVLAIVAMLALARFVRLDVARRGDRPLQLAFLALVALSVTAITHALLLKRVSRRLR
jgi:hypothetical protein